MSRPVVKRLAALTAVAAVVGGLVAFADWWSHPTLFRGVGFDLAYYGTVAVPNGQVSADIMVPFEDGAGAVITLRSVAPNFAHDSARAAVTFTICDGNMVGLVVTPTTPDCTRVGGVPGRIDLRTSSHESLLMSVRAESRGEVRIKSITVSYREGVGNLWRQGTETLPITLAFKAR